MNFVHSPPFSVDRSRPATRCPRRDVAPPAQCPPCRKYGQKIAGERERFAPARTRSSFGAPPDPPPDMGPPMCETPFSALPPRGAGLSAPDPRKPAPRRGAAEPHRRCPAPGSLIHLEEMVGAARFELTTYCTQNSRATRLRYAPTAPFYRSKPQTERGIPCWRPRSTASTVPGPMPSARAWPPPISST